MGCKGNRGRMPREERAKQFQPFAALRGYEEALRKKERIVVPKPELAEDYKEELDFKVRRIKKNDIVTVIYFYRDECRKITGMVSRIDTAAGVITIVNSQIAFDDLVGVEIVSAH